jgi:Fe-S-cluster-containing hydrogenase component 2
VGCGDCVRICPVSAISLVRGKAVIDVETCIGCKSCNRICSYGAVR